MSIVAIDPNMLRSQSQETKKSNSFGMSDFNALMTAAAPAASAAVQYNYGYQPAAVTNAAVSGVTGATSVIAGNSPYYSPMSSITAGGIPTTPIDYTGIPNSSGSSTGLPPLPTSSTGGAMYTNAGGGMMGLNATGNDTQDKLQLFQYMNDKNWEMLFAQVTVNEISRDFQARSNILKTKADTEVNAVRNMRA